MARVLQPLRRQGRDAGIWWGPLPTSLLGLMPLPAQKGAKRARTDRGSATPLTPYPLPLGFGLHWPQQPNFVGNGGACPGGILGGCGSSVRRGVGVSCVVSGFQNAGRARQDPLANSANRTAGWGAYEPVEESHLLHTYSQPLTETKEGQRNCLIQP